MCVHWRWWRFDFRFDHFTLIYRDRTLLYSCAYRPLLFILLLGLLLHSIIVLVWRITKKNLLSHFFLSKYSRFVGLFFSHLLLLLLFLCPLFAQNYRSRNTRVFSIVEDNSRTHKNTDKKWIALNKPSGDWITVKSIWLITFLKRIAKRSI